MIHYGCIVFHGAKIVRKRWVSGYILTERGVVFVAREGRDKVKEKALEGVVMVFSWFSFVGIIEVRG